MKKEVEFFIKDEYLIENNLEKIKTYTYALSASMYYKLVEDVDIALNQYGKNALSSEIIL